MKHFSMKMLLTLGFCLVFFMSTTSAQKNKSEVETKVEPEVKSEPVEVKTEPSSPPTTTNDSPPVYEPTKSSSSSDSSSTNENTSNQPSTPNRSTSANERQRNQRRAKQKEEIERQKRKARRKNKRDKKDRGYYVNCPTYDPYGECDNYYDDNDDVVGNRTINPYIYFDRNDRAYFNYLSYFESVTTKYKPFFAEPLSNNYKPLYTIGIVEAAEGLPYTTPFWNFYYEPDLDNFYVDFERLANTKLNLNSKENFERLVIRATSKKTIKKVGKQFKYKGKVRPVIVEDISKLPLDRIYTFNLSYLPKGKYELLLLSRDGHTVKLGFEIE